MLKDRLSKTNGWQFYKWLFGPETFSGLSRNRPQEPVVQRVTNKAIRRINHYPLDSAIGFTITYPLDSDYPADTAFHRFNNWGQIIIISIIFSGEYKNLVLYSPRYPVNITFWRRGC